MARHISPFLVGGKYLPSVKRVVICNKCNIPLADYRGMDESACAGTGWFSTTCRLAAKQVPVQADTLFGTERGGRRG